MGGTLQGLPQLSEASRTAHLTLMLGSEPVDRFLPLVDDDLEASRLRGDVGLPTPFGISELASHSDRLFSSIFALAPARAVLGRPPGGGQGRL
jgi:hypothetical protein